MISLIFSDKPAVQTLLLLYLEGSSVTLLCKTALPFWINGDEVAVFLTLI